MSDDVPMQVRPTRWYDRWLRVALPVAAGVAFVALLTAAFTGIAAYEQALTNHAQGVANHKLAKHQAKVNNEHHTQTVNKDAEITKLLGQLKSIENKFLTDQEAIKAAGTIESRYALYLAETNTVICKTLAAACPSPPSLTAPAS